MDITHLFSLLLPPLWQAILNGLVIGSVYAIFALGYTLVFSILRVINFAHGAIFTLGAYFTFVLVGSKLSFSGLLANTQSPIKLPFVWAMIVGGILAGLCGIVIERLAFRPLRKRGADPLLALVSSLGIGVAIVNIIQYLFGNEQFNYPPNPFGKIQPAINLGIFPGQPALVRTVQLIMFVASIVIVVLLTLLINRTKVGKALQAVSEDTLTASLLGINPDQLILLTFFLSGLIGGVSGTLIGVSYAIDGPYFGVTYGLKGLAIIVLGGLGSIPGTVLGGFVLGLSEAMAAILLPSGSSGYKDAVGFALLFIVLLIRPQGLLGRSTIQKV